MAKHWEPNMDDDCSTSYFRKTVVLKDWWLIKCSNEFKGKRFGVAGFEESVETRAKRVFTSSPIIKALDIFNLETSDGIIIILRGFINKERVLEYGFLPEIFREFIFGFPPGWQRICNNCYAGVQNHANDENHGGEGFDKAKSSDVEKDGECEVIIGNEVTTPSDGCGNVDNGEQRRKSQLKVTGASLRRLFNDLDVSSKPVKKSGKTLKSDGNVVEEPLNHSGTKVKTADKRKLDTSEVQNPTTNDGVHGSKNATKESLSSVQGKGRVKTSLHSKSKGLNNSSSKSGKKGKSKESEWDVVEPMNNTGSEVEEAEENLSWGKTQRKIDFDLEVTPEKEVNKQETNLVSTDSLGQKRSRSGRLLVSPLEFWRNQVPIYDKDRNLIQVKEGHETNSTSSNGSGSRKPRRSRIK